MILHIRGHIPAKKNTWRPKPGGVYQRKDVRAEMDGVILQIKSQWKCAPLEETAFLKLAFTVPNGKSDLDNRATTVIDCLVKAGVVKNDSIARINSFSAEATINPKAEEGCLVHIY